MRNKVLIGLCLVMLVFCCLVAKNFRMMPGTITDISVSNETDTETTITDLSGNNWIILDDNYKLWSNVHCIMYTHKTGDIEDDSIIYVW